jgi:uncharacterized membrane protein
VSESAESFVAVQFDDVATAEDALVAVRELETKKAVHVRDAAVVVRTAAGRIELQQTRDLAAGEGVVAGGAVGIVAGLLLGVPVGGALVGLLGGTGIGLRDTGIPDRRLRQLGEDLQAGHAVLCVLVDAAGLARLRESLARYGEVLDAEVPPPAAP